MHRLSKFFDTFSNKVTKLTETPWAFITAFVIVVVWGISGPLFHYSDTWQLVINTGTTIITFLMVFVIQQSQNKDTIAIHLKLNELIAATEKASNRLIDVEDITEEELEMVKKYYSKLTEVAKLQKELETTHVLKSME